LIYRGAFYNNPVMFTTAKVEYRTSLVVTAIAIMHRGVCIWQVPMQDLGANQVAKASHINKNIEVWYFDEIQGSVGTLVQNCLKLVDQDQSDTWLLFCSHVPQVALIPFQVDGGAARSRVEQPHIVAVS
jgi:hypothetical protein